jgi:hypothetical protein
MPKYDYEHDEAVLTKERTKIDEPPRYRVVLHNDDFTTMEFVIEVLETIFNLSVPEAIRVMLEVHTQGKRRRRNLHARNRRNESRQNPCPRTTTRISAAMHGGRRMRLGLVDNG